eukprot:m.32779 g.32779  ORF g.32779 m.32779 type:complete len:813 (+) comp9806_c0_seq1:137-2575(+)
MMMKVVVLLAAIAVFAGVTSAQQDCTNLNRDYCEADDSCEWSQDLGSCGNIGCGSYGDHATCTADPRDVGPCSYEWALRVCYPKNGVIPCSSYWEDCPTSRCKFDEDLGVCYPKDGSVPCYANFEETSCSSATNCQWVDGSCMSKGEASACSVHFEEKDCPSQCTWYSESYVCYPKDLPLPCNMLFEEDKCAANSNCHMVTVGDSVSICTEKSKPLDCSEYTSTSFCPNTRCMWNDAAARCYDPEIGIDCEYYTNPDGCPADKCRLVNGQCLDKEQPLDCSQFFYGDEQCNKDSLCRPDCDNHICVACPATGACDDTPCPNVDPEPTNDCDTKTTKSECTSNADCIWNPTVETCEFGGAGVPCSTYLEEGQCSNHQDCAWDNGVCISCENGNCGLVTTTMTPDTGDACKTYNVDSCPFPRCAWKYAPGSQEGTCADATCADIYDLTECEAKDGCEFNSEAYICYNKEDGPPCSYFGSQGACSSYSTCEWDATTYSCHGKDTNKPCTTYKSSNCPVRCSINYDKDTCQKKSCRDFYQKDSCESNGCTYDEDAFICYKDTGVACKKYSDFDTCPPNRCVFRYSNDGTSGTCTEKSCVDAYTKTDCLAIKGCQFLDSVNLCFKDTGNPCESYKSYENCPMNRCSWFTDDGSTFICNSKVCSDFYEQDMCESASCQWDQDSFSCFNDTHKSCDKYDKRTCPTNRCVYDYNFGLCRTYDCGDIYDQTKCASSSLGCEFDPKYGICHEKGEPIPCAVFNYNEGECPTDRCTFDRDVQACFPTGGEVPCGEIYDKDPCNSRDYCKWNSKEFRCMSAKTL